MTYPSENFYPGIEAHRATPGLETGGGRALIVAYGMAATGIDRARQTAGSLIETYRYWRSMRATIRQLSTLDDAILRDIGLHRGQIAPIARHLALTKRRTD